ncbi:MAG: RDD family protein [Acidimicrobiales bacterium]|nr:RDD family protein [Acidimicrobiales bacterium]MXX41520.1 RDD family protein [Acidimicrobiales bacterium]MYB80790.1 RDD family protein [Acidimicrobiales bacterium]MYI08547.1 RDD family protein [Acidimicrobiales bacterium]MYI11116.1 RDD family protein [Acidimicrobiales bacterium]
MSDYGEPPSHDGNRRTGWAELGSGETVELARIGARFGARVLDIILEVVAVIVLGSVLIGGWLTGDADSVPDIGVGGLLISAAVGVAYEVVLIALWGQTLGKRMVGIRVINAAHGGVPGWGKSSGRWAIPGLLALIPAVGWILSILCYISATWDRVYQGWHDKVAGTLVVKK